MNYIELQRYIAELTQSGFDTTQLQVQYYKKFSTPMFALIMALIAVPFAFSGNRGGAHAGGGVEHCHRHPLHRGQSVVRTSGEPEPIATADRGLVAGRLVRPCGDCTLRHAFAVNFAWWGVTISFDRRSRK